MSNKNQKCEKIAEAYRVLTEAASDFSMNYTGKETSKEARQKAFAAKSSVEAAKNRLNRLIILFAEEKRLLAEKASLKTRLIELQENLATQKSPLGASVFLNEMIRVVEEDLEKAENALMDLDEDKMIVNPYLNAIVEKQKNGQ